ncbi:4511_t:CDS:2, partial [Gigaspora rosea]
PPVEGGPMKQMMALLQEVVWLSIIMITIDKTGDQENKNRTKGKKKAKFVDLPVVTKLGDKEQKKVLDEKLRPGRKKLESK